MWFSGVLAAAPSRDPPLAPDDPAANREARLKSRDELAREVDAAGRAGKAANEKGFLPSEPERTIPGWPHEARKRRSFVTGPECFARYCVTFSHGDFPDEAPARTGGRTPCRGQGRRRSHTFAGLKTHSVLRQPKGHASISRRAESGCAIPVAVDRTTHRHDRSGIGLRSGAGGRLESESVMVPPMSRLTEQSSLRPVGTGRYP